MLSLIITILAYVIVVQETFAMTAGVIVLGLLALLQMFVQLFLFLHLGDDSKPRLKLISFIFMAGILSIIVIGSLWIMYHLDYNMMNMTPEAKELYMTGQKDKGF